MSPVDRWHWIQIQNFFVAYGPRILVCIIVLVGIFAMAKLMKARVLSRKKAAPPDPDVQFLEGALEDDAPRKPVPGYTYEQFKEDLYNKGLSFEEIYEKCGGVFPQKPPPAPPPILPMSIHEIQGQNGDPGFEGIKGADGPQGADGRCPDRMTQLQQWFKERGKTSPIGGLVKPPPNPYPVVHKIYIRGRR